MITRRDLLKAGALGLVGASACRPGEPPTPESTETVLNDIHSQLNATRVGRVVCPTGFHELEEAVAEAARSKSGVSIAGGRHAMGGQQFGEGTTHLDMKGLNRILRLDSAAGTVDVEAGIEWPELIDGLLQRQHAASKAWGIRQKQTGADRLSLGGALASNIHGRGLTMAPFVDDIESFTLIGPSGDTRTCSRSENSELFRLAIGGYGLFGVVYSIRLRLAPRRKLERVVEVLPIGELESKVAARLVDGYEFGDFQFLTDATSPEFLQRGVFSCYRPVPSETPIPERQRGLAGDDWRQLLYLAHVDKARAFDQYADYYLTTNGQIYWSDTHQLSFYADDYHAGFDLHTGAAVRGTEMISEVYVPRRELPAFLEETAVAFRDAGADVIYGTVRWIERDAETFLPWAREPFASIVFNLHVDHTADGMERAKREFRLLIDLARGKGGSYFLTYHRWATREQVDACYPEVPGFLAKKLEYDPEERFQSSWYRHYKAMYRGHLS